MPSKLPGGHGGLLTAGQPADLAGSRQDSARQDSARQDSARQDSARQDSARQDSARQDTAREDTTRPTADAAGGSASRRQGSGWLLAVPPLATLAVVLCGITGPWYWRDEGATLSATGRSLPQLLRMLGHVDAVHGLYYLLMWPVVRLFGGSELVTRLPSALGMAAAALGVAAIGRRIASPRAGLLAGLVFAGLPAVSGQGHDARPYAMVTAAAVLASYLLVRVAAQPRCGWLAGYGLSLALLGYLHLFALLLIPAHAITVARAGQRRLLRSWLAAVAAACAAVTPLALLGWDERRQISWMTRPGWPDAYHLVLTLTGGSAGSAVLIGLLGVAGEGARAGTLAPSARLAAPWLVLPPATLLLVSTLKPVYYVLYVTFCLPAVALLAGAGLATLDRRSLTAAVALLVTLSLPAQAAVRQPAAGGYLGLVAQIVQRGQRPGDAVLYPGSGLPSWTAAYPGSFGPLRDIGRAEPAAAAGRLDGTPSAPPVIARRLAAVRRLWVITMADHFHPAGPATNRIGAGTAAAWPAGLRLARTWRVASFTIQLFLRAGSPRPG